MGEVPGGTTGVPCGVGGPTGAPPTSAAPGVPYGCVVTGGTCDGWTGAGSARHDGHAFGP